MGFTLSLVNLDVYLCSLAVLTSQVVVLLNLDQVGCAPITTGEYFKFDAMEMLVS